MSDQWYPFYPGDYAKETMHLTLIQHGAYRMLLDCYYSVEGGLDANADVLYRICRAFDEGERNAVDLVLDEFFINKYGRYRHKRADREIAKKGEISEKRRQAALQRHHGYDAKAHTTTTTTTDTTRPIPIATDNILSDFDVIWKDYPNKAGKSNARKAYVKARKNGTSKQDVIDGLARYRAYVDSQRANGFKDRKFQNGSTWFSQNEWESEYGTDGGEGKKPMRFPLTASDRAIK